MYGKIIIALAVISGGVILFKKFRESQDDLSSENLDNKRISKFEGIDLDKVFSVLKAIDELKKKV